VFDRLVASGRIQTLSRRELKRRAVSSITVPYSAIPDVPSPFVATIESGYVFTETGLLTTSEFEIIEESAATPERAQQAMMAMSSRELFFGQLPVRSLAGGKPPSDVESLRTVAPVIPRYPTNYYHWMVETVPKIKYLREFERQTDTTVTLLVPSEVPPFVTETLDLLDWPTSKVISATEPMYHVHGLVVPSFPERTVTDFEWIRESILDAVSTGTADADDATNIYVSRENAIARRVVNEDEVMDVLSEYGFERYLLEDRTLAENARLFDQADVVVGPHGAGLTDILFTENCALVELFGSRRNKAYEMLSGTLGIDYEPMYCRADAADIVVDTGQLADKVAAVLD